MKVKPKKSSTPANPADPFHKQYGLFSNIRYILGAMKKYGKILLLFIPIAMVCNILFSYLWTFLSKFIIDLIPHGNESGEPKKLFITVAVFCLIMLLLFFVRNWYKSLDWVKKVHVRMKVIMEKNYKNMTMPFEFTEDPKVLDASNKAEQTTGSNDKGIEGMEASILDFFSVLGTVIFGLFLLSGLNLPLTLLMAALAFVNFFISNAANKHSKTAFWDPLAPWWRKDFYMSDKLADFSYAKDIRMYSLRPWLTKKYTNLKKIRYQTQLKNDRFWFWIGFLGNFLWILSQIAVYAYLIYKVYLHQMTIGNFTLYLTSSQVFYDKISSLLSEITKVLQRSREIDDFRSFMDLKKEDVQKSQAEGGELASDDKITSEKIPLPSFSSYEFTFQNLSFKYPRSDAYALKNLNLTLKAGERLAVVGLNGAGKSTFIKLLLGLYQPSQGKILLNGNDILQYDRQSYFKIFAPVFQDVNLFAFTLQENISMQEKENTDSQQVEKVLKDAGLDPSDKQQFPDGLDTQILKVLYDQGIDLSGGQKQKVALARALYKNAPVVILDEPTAALDALAEHNLYENFDKLIGGKTAVYISHRLSSTQFCNNVAMFKDGQLIEYGTHASLLEKNGEYAKMFRTQAKYYEENQNADGENPAAEITSSVSENAANEENQNGDC